MILLIVLLASLVGGTNTPLVKFNVNHFSPIMVAFLRFLLALLIISPFVLSKSNKVKKPNKELLFANMLFAINILIFVYAIQYTSILVAQSLYLLAPVFVAVLAYIFLKEKLLKYQIAGLLTAMSGLGILIEGSLRKNDIMSFGTPLGNTAVLVAVVVWSLYIVLSKKLGKNYSPLNITFYNFLVTMIVAGLLVLFNYTNQIDRFPLLTNTLIASVFAMSFFSTVVFFFLFQIVIKKTSAFISTLVNYLASVFAGLIGVIFFSERLTANLLLGAVLIIAGVFITTSYPNIQKFVKF